MNLLLSISVPLEQKVTDPEELKSSKINDAQII